MKKAKPTLEDHRRLGAILQRLHHELAHAQCRIQNAYPVKSFVSRKAHEIVQDLHALRSEMENNAALEFRTTWDTQLYYPGTSEGGMVFDPDWRDRWGDAP